MRMQENELLWEMQMACRFVSTDLGIDFSKIPLRLAPHRWNKKAYARDNKGSS